MWDVIGPVLEQYGLPVGLLLCAVLGLVWAWKKERDENRELNRELRKSAKETTEALVAVKNAAVAQKEVIGSLDQRLGGFVDSLRALSEKQQDRTDHRLGDIEKRLVEALARMESRP